MKNTSNKQQYRPFANVLLGMITLGTLLLNGCGASNNATVADNNSNLSSAIVVEKAATIPALNGTATPAGIYIRNTTGKTISGISYALAQTTSPTSLTINSASCNTIEANSSCLLPVTTPALLSVGAAGSNIVVATYNGQQSKQLINYRYLNSNNYSGVNFSDNSQTLFGSNDYATVYVFVGKGQSQNNVGFNLNNNSLAIMNGLTNGTTNIPANGVVPLEIKSNQNVTSNLVTVTPYSHTSSKNLQKALTSGVENNSQLQVAITPTKQANLLMSDLPLLTAAQAEATLTIINNGNQTAAISNLTSSNNADVTVSTAASNACGASLDSGASCNYTISKGNNNSNNGSAILTLAYNNSLADTTTTQTAYYQNSNTAPMVAAVATQTSFSEQISTTTPITFNITNIGNVPLNTVTITPQTTLAHTTPSIINNTCTSTIAANGNCSVHVNVAASALADSGIIYLNVSGDYTNGTTTTNYSFMSKPVTATIIDSTNPTVTSTTPQNTATDVATTTGIVVNFSEAMTATTLTNSNITLQKVSDSSSVSLTSQGVSNNDQTVTFSLTSGNLVNNTDYRIVINPSQIQDVNGNAMGAATSETIATFKTAVDNTAPTISTFTPADSATNQSRTPAITLTFSEAMDQSTLTSSNIILQTQGGTAVTGTTISYDPITYIATVNLNSTQLTSQTTYQLRVNQNNIKDVAGNTLGSNASYQVSQFTVGDYTAPTLVDTSTVPVNGATDIAADSAISLTFSEAMNTATLTATNIQLLDSNSNPVTLDTPPAYSNNNQTVTFQPAVALTGGASYSIVINPSAIKDVAGNAMGSATSQTVSSFMIVVSAIYITPIKTVHPGGVFNLEVTETPSATVSIMLPTGFSSSDGNSYTCVANPTCSKAITVDSSVTAGYHTVTTSMGQSITIPVATIKNIAYIPNSTTSGLQVEVCDFVSSSLTNCINAQPNLNSQQAFGVTISATGQYAYIATGGANGTSGSEYGVYKCLIDQANKKLSACSRQTNLGDINTRLGAISTNGKYFYINSLNDSTIRKCNISEIDGTLQVCTIGYSGLTASVERLVLDYNGNNLFVNTGSGTKSCSINNDNGVISSCISSGFNSSATGIGFNIDNTRMYFTMVGNSSAIWFCSYNNSTHLLTGCQNAFSSSLGTTGWITGISFSTDTAFVSSTADIYSCPMNNTTGMLSTCSSAASSSSSVAQGITVFN